MKKFFNGHMTALVLAALVLFSACDTTPVEPEVQVGEEGYYIINEGGFGNGNTSVSFYDRTSSSVTNNVFAAANNIPLGDQAQSMTIFGDYGYIVVQNSDKVEVVNLSDFTIDATISEGLPNPRYFLGISDTKGYVSDWGETGTEGSVKVIDLTNNTVSGSIATGQGANQMALIDGMVYVTNAGGFGRDNTISVIDPSSDRVTDVYEVADNPNSLKVDADGNIWVTTSGHTAYDPSTFEVIEAESTAGSLIKLGADGTVAQTLSFGVVGWSSSIKGLQINQAGTEIFFLYDGDIYKMGTDATTLPTEPFLSLTEGGFYGMAVDPIDDTIIGCVAPSFSAAGSINIYNPDGTLKATYEVGIGPNGATFK